ncbi:glycerophosphoinositol inositolphosphodiesterase GDPD2 isoform X2 [Pygocentrus nattereri]|uniref:glycerophosphoinositol inositolphosphodiesterase GDPD2 isoform X2 n=1 Tax=Pygocentrus nattereri TaxID=42514 RepID=UPI001891C783|nr:glycerophosphoinositol inositolphosphodiesterase GDPD2 isoform X2 [Pygocentrus nattereri]
MWCCGEKEPENNSWNHWEGITEKCACFWFSFLSLVSVSTLGWVYICFIAYNDHSDVNWKAFEKFSRWVNWFMCVIILSSVMAIYCLLLLLFSLFQFAIKEPLDLHWLHKVLLFLGLVIVVVGIAGISSEWKEEWSTIHLSLQATAPFLQLGAVVALTMLSWLVFQSYHRTQSAASKALIIGALVAVSVAIFLSPLLIHSPCIIDKLPPKPALIGHRGAPVLAPENTMMSFRRSAECEVIAFETDVQLSKDKKPFLMHDNGTKFLRRTTNVDVVFPEREDNSNSDFTLEELQSLKAGEWFLKTDPFWSVNLLSEEEKENARTQTVPTLSELLDLAKERNISVIFDLKNGSYDCNVTVTTILNSSISHNLIWWLPSTCREDVKKHAQSFRQVYSNVSEMKDNNGSFLNVKYSSLSTEEIRNLTSRNVMVNLWVVNERWLFSLLWCSGASSVTTNTCHVLSDMSHPDWHLKYCTYLIIWITADLVSLVLMVVLFYLQRRKKSRNLLDSSLNRKEMYPFLSKKEHVSSFE